MAEMFARTPDGKEVVFTRDDEVVVLKPVEPIILSLKCRICKKFKPHKVILEFGEMPKGLACVECFGCGVVGIEKVPDDDVK